MNTPEIVVIAYGAGTNSDALLVGMIERGYPPPAAILFANTGGERPRTYDHLAIVSEYLVKHGYPPITTVQRVKKDQTLNTLELRCFETKTLPSIAYGHKTCSHKFKIQPQEKWCNNHKPFKAHWKAGGKVTRYIGYDFAEKRRWMQAKIEDKKYFYQFPLVEWEWTRADCVAAIERAGLPQPGKSACTFCPSSKKHEIVQLRTEYPLLFQRALDIEARALNHGMKCEACDGSGKEFNEHAYAFSGTPSIGCTTCNGSGRVPSTVKGLGRNFAWRDIDEALLQKDEEINTPGCDYCVDFSSE